MHSHPHAPRQTALFRRCEYPHVASQRPLGAQRPGDGPITAAGARRELARYQVPEGTRTVVPQRIDGRVAISDVWAP